MNWSDITGTPLYILAHELSVAFYQSGLEYNHLFRGVWWCDRYYATDNVVWYDGTFWRSRSSESNWGNIPCPGSPVWEESLYAISPGANLQTLSFWGGMQSSVEAAVHPESPYPWVKPSILNEGHTGFDFYDLESLAEDAGLVYPGLWRRKVNMSDDFSYGAAQPGDILGPWIIEDLRRALSVGGRYLGKVVGSIYKISFGSTNEEVSANWDGATWWYTSGYHSASAGRKMLRRTMLAHAWRSSDGGPYPSHPLFWPGTVVKYYLKGDAIERGWPYDAFDSFGDPGVVEGVDSEIMRFSRAAVYPDDACRTGRSRHYWFLPSMPTSAPTFVDDSNVGYLHPFQSAGEQIISVQAIVESSISYQ